MPSQVPFLFVFAIASAVVLTRSVLVVGAASLFLRTRLAQRRRVYRRPFAQGQLRSEAIAALAVLLLDVAVFSLLRSQGWIAFAEPTAGRYLFTFVLFFVWYEVWFYVTHRAMHVRWLYFLHAQHHVAKVTHPLTSLSFGLAERLILLVGALGFAALASRVVPIVFPAVVTYFLLNFLLNVWGHLNVELLPAGYGRSWLSRVFISTTFHAMHHARYQGHYGLFTPVLDRMLGTAWEDYPEIHARAATGRGPTRMAEKMPTGPANEQATVAPSA